MRRLLLLTLAFLPVYGFSQDLIRDNETVLVEFKTQGQHRLVIAKNTSDTYLVYRYGIANNVEIETPTDMMPDKILDAVVSIELVKD